MTNKLSVLSIKNTPSLHKLTPFVPVYIEKRISFLQVHWSDSHPNACSKLQLEFHIPEVTVAVPHTHHILHATHATHASHASHHILHIFGCVCLRARAAYVFMCWVRHRYWGEAGGVPTNRVEQGVRQNDAMPTSG